MKIILCFFILFSFGRLTLNGQSSEPATNPGNSTTNESQAPSQPKPTTSTSNDGPIREWSNPPGYMGSQKKVKMVKKKNKKHKHKPSRSVRNGKKKRGCYGYNFQPPIHAV